VTVEVRPVRTGRELGAFVRLPWRLYRDEPRWVAPLLMDVKKRLDQHKNPFFKHAQAQYFLAYRDGRPVGRISAHVDQNFNRFQGNEWGLFGWFECEEDPEAVRVFALGVKPAYQHTGVAARFYQMHFDAAERTPQKGGEMGWILETNTPMNRAMEGMGGEIKRRYRVYERSL
jgi:GNAT superfamily N-acetyltransferase